MTPFELRSSEEERVAYAIAGSLCTDAMIGVLVRSLSGRSVEQGIMMFRSVLPPQDRRSGPLLPLLVAGELKDFPHRVHDAVALLLGMLSATGDVGVAAIKCIVSAAEFAATNKRGINVGSEQFYALEGNQSPTGLKTFGSRVAPFQLYAAQGIAVDVIGTGYDSASSIKGSLPATAFPGGASVAPRAVVQDPALSALTHSVSGTEPVK